MVQGLINEDIRFASLEHTLSTVTTATQTAGMAP